MSESEQSESEKKLRAEIESLGRRIKRLERPDLGGDRQLPEHLNDRRGYPGIPNGSGYYTPDGR